MQSKGDFWTSDEKKSSFASPRDAATAVGSLTDHQFRALGIFAKHLMSSQLDRMPPGRDDADLLQEAIAATLDGRRDWKGVVPLVTHLKGAMRSIAFAWKEKAATESRAVLPAERSDEDERAAVTPFHNLPSREPSPEKQAETNQALEIIWGCFREDEIARNVLNEMMLGGTTAEILESTGLEQRAFDAARKRIWRCVSKLPEIVAQTKKQPTAGEVP